MHLFNFDSWPSRTRSGSGKIQYKNDISCCAKIGEIRDVLSRLKK